MKQDIIVAGVGGQGIISIAFVLVNSAMLKGLNSKQSEVHGMSQRGGPVFAYVRISDGLVYSDLIPAGEADIIIALEEMEALRYADNLKKDGKLIVDQNIIPVEHENGGHKEQVESVIKNYPHHIFVPAKQIAQEAGNILAANMVMIGAASPFIQIEESYLKESIKILFSRKSEEVVTVNLAAFEKGVEVAQKFLNAKEI